MEYLKKDLCASKSLKLDHNNKTSGIKTSKQTVRKSKKLCYVRHTQPQVSLDIEQNPQMDNALLSQIIEFVKLNGFDIENLIKTSHS